MLNPKSTEMDPRESILRHEKEAATEYKLWTDAYATTQPKPIFHEEEKSEGEDSD
eukprot:gene4304-14415_t